MTLQIAVVPFILWIGIAGCDVVDNLDLPAESILLCGDELFPRELTLRFVDDEVTVIDPVFSSYDLTATLPNRDEVIWEWTIREPVDTELYPDYAVDFIYSLNTVNGRFTFRAFDLANNLFYKSHNKDYWCEPAERMVE